MDVLELDADRAPDPPGSLSTSKVIGVRVPRHLWVWVREQAAIDRRVPSEWVRTLIVRERDGHQLPRDCRDWLTIQAAQCGAPGDPDHALVTLIRHLADRYPNGARLR